MSATPYAIHVTPGGTEWIETKCPRKHCERPYRIDALHPEYAEIIAALDRGDRSVLRCYHQGLPLGM